MMLLVEVLAAIKKTYHLRHNGYPLDAVIPPVISSPALTNEDLKQIVFSVRLIVFCFLFWKPGRCVYRSVALASVLRRRGVPLTLNFGWRKISEKGDKVKAHCWLDLNGKRFAEKGNPNLSYPILLGRYKKYANYWIKEWNG